MSHVTRSTDPRRPGFTLVELLVVISIIALLIGILLPVLAKVRKAGNAAVCMSNMRSLGQATTLYQTDYNRYLPQPSSDGHITDATDRANAIWFNALDTYLQQSSITGNSASDRNYESFKQDPVWNNLPVTVQTTSGTTELDIDDVRTIKMNEFLGWITASSTPNNPAPTGPRFKFYRITDIKQPSKTVLYIDGRGHDTPATSGTVDSTGSRQFWARPIHVGLRHDDGANVTRVDGSVAYTNSEIRETGSGYRGWYDDDDPAKGLRPEVVFNFRPDDFN